MNENQTRASEFEPWTPEIYFQYYHDPYEFALAAINEVVEDLKDFRASVYPAIDREYCLRCLIRAFNAIAYPNEFKRAWHAGREQHNEQEDIQDGELSSN